MAKWRRSRSRRVGCAVLYEIRISKTNPNERGFPHPIPGQTSHRHPDDFGQIVRIFMPHVSALNIATNSPVAGQFVLCCHLLLNFFPAIRELQLVCACVYVCFGGLYVCLRRMCVCRSPDGARPIMLAALKQRINFRFPFA